MSPLNVGNSKRFKVCEVFALKICPTQASVRVSHEDIFCNSNIWYQRKLFWTESIFVTGQNDVRLNEIYNSKLNLSLICTNVVQ